MTEVDQASSFRLFGTLIVKDQGARQQGAEEEEEEEAPQLQQPESTPTQPGADVEAAAAAAARGQLPCPRCKSKKTKFCYFNNYNVNQPRHFCKACHRYWTAGGALRNVPNRAAAHRRGPASSAGRRRRGLTDPVPSSLIA